LSQEELAQRTSGSGSPVWAIARREIKYLIRTPIYLFNSLVMLAFVPLLLVVQVFAFGGMGQLLNTVQAVPKLYQIAAIAGFVGLMALFTPAASSSFSREGKLFYISKLIPVAPAKQIQAKILYSYIIAALALPFVILAALVLSWNAVETLLAATAGLIISLPAIIISLLIDLLRPYLNWDNPQKAIKQNFNVVLAMAAGGGLFYLLYLLGGAVFRATQSPNYVYMAVLGASLLAGGIGYAVLTAAAVRQYSELET